MSKLIQNSRVLRDFLPILRDRYPPTKCFHVIIYIVPGPKDVRPGYLPRLLRQQAKADAKMFGSLGLPIKSRRGCVLKKIQRGSSYPHVIEQMMQLKPFRTSTKQGRKKGENLTPFLAIYLMQGILR